MSELVYGVNTALKNMIDWDTLNDGTVPDFLPITGYENTTAPFVLYSIVPRVVSNEKYFQAKDGFRYYVYDTNIDRMWAISRAIRDALNVTSDEGLETLKAALPGDCEFRILWSVLRHSISFGPAEREGFANTANEFEIAYVRDDA